MQTATTAAPGIAYSPATTGDGRLTEALTCIISGRPLPAELQPPRFERPCPASVEEGIRTLLAGPGR